MTPDMLKNLENMLTQGQDNAMLRYSLGNAYLQNKDFTTAITHFAKAVEFDPNYSAAWKGYGKALVNAGQDAQAIEVYNQGLAVAEKKGDMQAVKEMQVFLKRLHKTQPPAN